MMGRGWTQERKDKQILRQTGRKHSEESKRKMSTIRTGMRLPPQSQETKDKRAAALRGQKRTAEQRKNISVSLLGKKKSEEHRRKMSIYRKGRHPWNYGGGIPLSRNYAEYLDWRKSVYTRDNYACQVCDTRGCRLVAHHILPYAKYPEYRHEPENGITLCRPCHRFAAKSIYKYFDISDIEQGEANA